MRSLIPGIVWPAVPSVPIGQLTALLYQLEHTQWMEPLKLEALQTEQLVRFLDHARLHSAFYAEKLTGNFQTLPLLTRQDLIHHAEEIYVQSPTQHGVVVPYKTSGSTGEPVQVLRTGVNQLMWLALLMREHLWFRRDFSRTLVAIKANTPMLDDDAEARARGWGEPVSLLHQSGPSYAAPLSMDVEAQVDWILKKNPGYLITYPTNLRALLESFEERQLTVPGLLEVRTVGEMLPEDLRELCRRVLGVELVDVYSAQEVGVIAIQCPSTKLYHIQAESLIVEVLKDDGTPCAEGETGRVVVTDPHNFATPLLRYDIRDYATVGPVCPCGRGLPTLSKIVGRRRNLVHLPDGTKHWPIFGLHHFEEVCLVRQYQVVQTSLERIEFRLRGKLDAGQELALTKILWDALGHAFKIDFRYFDTELPGTGPKFEEFISLVPDPPA